MQIPSLEAAELYNVAIRTIALAGIYTSEDYDWAMARLRKDQQQYTKGDNTWQAYEHIIAAIYTASL